MKNEFQSLQDEIFNDYMPTGFGKRQTKPRLSRAGLSRQNSTHSIGSIKDNKEETQSVNSFTIPKRHQNSFHSVKQQTKNKPFSRTQQQNPPTRGTLFGAHRQTARRQTSPSPIRFEDLMKNPQLNQAPSRPPLPEKKAEKKNLQDDFSPQNILEEQMNTSIASRRGRPPLNRRNQNKQSQQNLKGNFSEDFGAKNKACGFQNNSLSINANQPFQVPISEKKPKALTIEMKNTPQMASKLDERSLNEIRKFFQEQIQFHRKQSGQILQRQKRFHQKEIESLKKLHQQQIKKRLELKQFQLQKQKEFYQSQLKILKQRELQIREYSVLNKKLESNISSIQKMGKDFSDKEKKMLNERDTTLQKSLETKKVQLEKKEKQLQTEYQTLKNQKIQFRKEKQDLFNQLSIEKQRIYNLQKEIQRKENELERNSKKRQRLIEQQYEEKLNKLQKEKQNLKIEELSIIEKKNLLQNEKQELKTLRKQFDVQKKQYLEQMHQQKTKVLEKQIELSSRESQIQIKEQEIEMNQSEYINKLKLLELQRKKNQIERQANRGKLYDTSKLTVGVKTAFGGSLGNRFGDFNKTSQSALRRDFYSGEQGEQSGNIDSSYKKSVIQLRDEFLKSLPKF